jgi:hypothetical protein
MESLVQIEMAKDKSFNRKESNLKWLIMLLAAFSSVSIINITNTFNLLLNH